MKYKKLYDTYKEVKFREDLKKKYKVQEYMLAAHTPSKLYPTRLDKILKSKIH